MSDRTERVLVIVVTMIFCVTTFLIGQVGNGKRKTQRKPVPPPVEACVEVCRCPKIVDIISVKGGIWDYPGEFFEAVLSNVVIKDTCTHCTNGVPAGSLKGTSDANMVPVDRLSRNPFSDANLVPMSRIPPSDLNLVPVSRTIFSEQANASGEGRP